DPGPRRVRRGPPGRVDPTHPVRARRPRSGLRRRPAAAATTSPLTRGGLPAAGRSAVARTGPPARVVPPDGLAARAAVPTGALLDHRRDAPGGTSTTQSTLRPRQRPRSGDRDPDHHVRGPTG